MNKNDKIIKRYNRVSRIYDKMDRIIKDTWRKELLKDLSGNVLEVGIGTGVNLSFYPKNITLTGVDFSPNMLSYAREKIMKNKYPFHINLIEADIQDLPFETDQFDYVVSTCVFCSVPNPIKGLEELKRVCKPTGKIVMLEHMRSDNKIIGFGMDLLNPVTVKLWGANINRRTMNNIKCAELNVEQDNRLMGSIMRKLTLKP